MLVESFIFFSLSSSSSGLLCHWKATVCREDVLSPFPDTYNCILYNNIPCYHAGRVLSRCFLEKLLRVIMATSLLLPLMGARQPSQVAGPPYGLQAPRCIAASQETSTAKKFLLCTSVVPIRGTLQIPHISLFDMMHICICSKKKCSDIINILYILTPCFY